MLKFFHLFLKKYIPDRHFKLLETNTYNTYFLLLVKISISKKNLDDCVPPHLKANYWKDKLKWLTSEVYSKHEEAYIRCKIQDDEWKSLTFVRLPNLISVNGKQTSKSEKECPSHKILSPLINM